MWTLVCGSKLLQEVKILRVPQKFFRTKFKAWFLSKGFKRHTTPKALQRLHCKNTYWVCWWSQKAWTNLTVRKKRCYLSNMTHSCTMKVSCMAKSNYSHVRTQSKRPSPPLFVIQLPGTSKTKGQQQPFSSWTGMGCVERNHSAPSGAIATAQHQQNLHL